MDILWNLYSAIADYGANLSRCGWPIIGGAPEPPESVIEDMINNSK